MTEITMPRLSDSMQDGTILTWLKADGDEVQAGEELLEIETDKATMAYESPAAGVLTIVAQAGETLAGRRADRDPRRRATRGGAAPAAPDREPAEPRPSRSPSRARAEPEPRPSRPTGRHRRRRQRRRPGARSAPRRSRAGSPAPTASTWPRCGEPGRAGGSPAPTSPPTPA